MCYFVTNNLKFNFLKYKVSEINKINSVGVDYISWSRVIKSEFVISKIT